MSRNENDNKRPRSPFGLGGGGGGGGTGTPERRRWRLSIGYILMAVLLLFVIQSRFSQPSNEIPFSRFLELVDQGKVESVKIGDTAVDGTLSDKSRFTSDLPGNFETTQLVDRLQAKGVKIEGAGAPSALLGILVSYVLPIAFLLGIYFFLFRRMAGGGGAGALNLGRNKVKIYDRKDLKTTFADVAGLDEAVQELEEIVDFLKNPKKYQRLGGRIPKGVLLLGPPGCGKTLLARAVAGEAKVPFFYMSGSEFVEMFVGLGAARVRELFQQAKEKAPCLVFLDELDTIGKSRAGGYGGSMGSHDEREQTLNQLLVEMDGFDTSKGVIIMAATNRHDVLDPALVRPGRFDRQVVVDLPDLRGREAILKVHARGVALDPRVDLHVIAARTPGFTGADLANVVNEAALLAARREKDSVGMAELEEAIDRVVAGLERKSRVLSEKDRKIVAVHEMGHALVTLSVPTADPLHRVSIIARGVAALGMTMQRPMEDRYLLTEPELHDRLAILLGGRTAEELSFKAVSTGAQNDLERATDIARAMVLEYGMSAKIGPVSYGHDGFRNGDGRALFPGMGRPEISEELQRTVDSEVSRILGEAHDRARVILDSKLDLLDKLSKVLMSLEVMEGSDVEAYVKGTKPIPEGKDLEDLVNDRAAAEPIRTPAPPPPPAGPLLLPEPAPAPDEVGS